MKAAAALLVELHRNPELRTAMSATAAADMEARRATQLGGSAYGELESALAASHTTVGNFETAQRETISTLRMQRLRDKLIAVKRRLGIR